MIDEDAPVRPAFSEKDRWASWCAHHRCFHYYRKLGPQPCACPEDATEIVLEAAGPMSVTIRQAYRSERPARL
jgi:hypothetical protein